MHRDFLRINFNYIDMKQQILEIIQNKLNQIHTEDVVSHNCYVGLYNEIEALPEVKNNGVLADVSKRDGLQREPAVCRCNNTECLHHKGTLCMAAQFNCKDRQTDC